MSNASLLRCLKAQGRPTTPTQIWAEAFFHEHRSHPNDDCAGFAGMDEKDRSVLGPNLVLWTGNAHRFVLELKRDA